MELSTAGINPIEWHRDRMNTAPRFYARMVESEHKSKMLYPAKLSYCPVRFPSIAGQIDKERLFLAQQLARFARHCSPEVAERRVNQANYHLTGAYQGGAEHDAFWQAFI